jgi:hypothetical protein
MQPAGETELGEVAVSLAARVEACEQHLHRLANIVNVQTLRTTVLWKERQAARTGATMPEHEHVEPLSEAAMAHIAGISSVEILKNFELVTKVLTALKTGTGHFETHTPWGPRWVTVTDQAPPEA